MPSQTFHLDRPESGSPDAQLPQYTREPKLPSYLQPRDNTTVDIEDEKQGYQCSSTVSSAQPHWGSASSMIPRALLVDAATSLTAYLYFTSLQARMALQQQSSLDLLSTLCSSLPEDVDSSLLHTCAHAISHEAEGLIASQSNYSHRLIIFLVLLKAFLGFVVLANVPKFVKPFDYLVASGAAHCLLLYIMVFIPVANLVYSAGITNGTVWLRVMSKILWLVALWMLLLRKRKAAIVLREREADSDAPLGDEQVKSSVCLA